MRYRLGAALHPKHVLDGDYELDLSIVEAVLEALKQDEPWAVHRVRRKDDCGALLWLPTAKRAAVQWYGPAVWLDAESPRGALKHYEALSDRKRP